MQPTALTLPPPQQIVAPSRVYELADGATDSEEFRGLDRDELAIQRILFGGITDEQARNVVVVATLNQNENVFPNGTTVYALRQLFRRPLRWPLLIADGQKLKISLTNNTGDAISVPMSILGLDGVQVAALHAQAGDWPQPVFLTERLDVAAGQQRRRMPVGTRAYDVILHRIWLTSDAPDDVRATFALNNSEFRQNVDESMVLAEFDPTGAAWDIRLSRRDALVLYLANNGAASASVTVLGEAYAAQ